MIFHHSFPIILVVCLLAFSPLPAASSPNDQPSRIRVAEAQLAALEKSVGPRLGVCAINTKDGAQIRFRADERFPLCSTFKVLLVSAILAKCRAEPDLLSRRVTYTKTDLVTYSPISENHVRDGMTVSELCAAALQYSDNTAANLLLKMRGGPAAVTAFARAIGNDTFRLDRWETDLNSALPGDPRDTVTPAAMAHSLQRLALGKALTKTAQRQLIDWMRGNTTGARRIRAGVPKDWMVGDKTGSGAYGTTNDVAILWPPEHPPIVLAIYYRQEIPDATWQDDIIAQATRIVRDALVPTR